MSMVSYIPLFFHRQQVCPGVYGVHNSHENGSLPRYSLNVKIPPPCGAGVSFGYRIPPVEMGGIFFLSREGSESHVTEVNSFGK